MILITGGTGFLGRHITGTLVKTGKKIRLISRNPEKHRDLEKGNCTLFEADVRNASSLERAMEGITHVVHAAALMSFWKKKREAMQAINVEGTRNLLWACEKRGIRKLVYISALAIIGDPLDPSVRSVNEDTPTRPPKNPITYAATKLRAEQEVTAAAGRGLPAVILTPPAVIGPGNWDESSAVFFKMMYRGPRFYTDSFIEMTAALDVAEAVRLMLESPHHGGERFFLVGRRMHSREFFGKIARSVGKPEPSLKMPAGLLKTMGFLSEAVSLCTGKEPLVTVDAARLMTTPLPYSFDGSRITREIPFSYRDINLVIEETGRKFLEERGR